MADAGLPIWIRCPMCEDFWCTHHGEHAHDCECGSIDDLLAVGIDPYRIPAGLGWHE